MDIISRGIPFNPLQQWQWKGCVSLHQFQQRSRPGLIVLGHSPLLKQPLWSREGTVHYGQVWVTLELGRGRQGEPHLRHMVMATERGHFLKLIEVFFQNKRKDCQAGEPHRYPLYTLCDVGLLTPLLPTQTMAFSGVAATWSYSQCLGMIKLSQHILSCIS